LSSFLSLLRVILLQNTENHINVDRCFYLTLRHIVQQ
jgi:hypothetical protein